MIVAVDIGGTSWVAVLLIVLLVLGYVAHLINRALDDRDEK